MSLNYKQKELTQYKNNVTEWLTLRKKTTKKTYYISASIKGSREASFSEVLIAMFQKLQKLNL